MPAMIMNVATIVRLGSHPRHGNFGVPARAAPVKALAFHSSSSRKTVALSAISKGTNQNRKGTKAEAIAPETNDSNETPVAQSVNEKKDSPPDTKNDTDNGYMCMGDILGCEIHH